jgi:hypothetical protein
VKRKLTLHTDTTVARPEEAARDVNRLKRTVHRTVVSGTMLAVVAAGALGLSTVQAGPADDGTNTLVTTVTGGERTASIDGGGALSFGSVEGAFANRVSEDVVGTLKVTDKTATGAGWIVTALASDLSYLGSNPGGQAIPAANVTVAAVNPPTLSAGMAIDDAGGPNELSGTVSLGE